MRAAFREGQRCGRLGGPEEIWLACEQHAASHDGEYPQTIMLGTGENDRFDHVRQREAALARRAQSVAVRLATAVVDAWRARTPTDWLDLPDALGDSALKFPACRLDSDSTYCGNVCDAYGAVASVAMACEHPADLEIIDSSRESGAEDQDESEAEFGGLFGSGVSQSDVLDPDLEERPLGEAPSSKDAVVVTQALAAVLADIEVAATGYGEVNADVLVDSVCAHEVVERVCVDLGPYSNRARRLRPLVRRIVQEHFARSGSDRASLRVGGEDSSVQWRIARIGPANSTQEGYATALYDSRMSGGRSLFARLVAGDRRAFSQQP